MSAVTWPTLDPDDDSIRYIQPYNICTVQWIGLRENLQETIDFPMKYGAFL